MVIDTNGPEAKVFGTGLFVGFTLGCFFMLLMFGLFFQMLTLENPQFTALSYWVNSNRQKQDSTGPQLTTDKHQQCYAGRQPKQHEA